MHLLTIPRIILCTLLAFFLVSHPSYAADVVDKMEKALMPGPLSKAHAKYEDDCNNCHKFFRQSRQNDMCLNCHDHENIKRDIKSGKGFHGRIPGIDDKDCKVCHREHIGRDADIVMFDKQTFNHNETDFVLRGSHLVVQCKSCHKPKKKYHEALHECIDCHKENEPHKGKLGKVCNSCHRESSWNDFQFDHSKTKFELVGKHKGVQCRDCHPQERYLSTPKECYSCHKTDDKHDGRFGQNCKKCHSSNGWAQNSFDHDKDTKFKLTGSHERVGCNQCHQDGKNAYKEKLSNDCYACHKFNDEHKGQFGKKCQDCHNTKAWGKNKFNHDKTDFPLKDKHKDVGCKDCHPGNIKDKVSTKCYDCHKQDDVHEGHQGEMCNDCHSEKGWAGSVNFDHNLFRFPLLGSHAALACEECHSSSNFKETKFQCYACHKKDDPHKRQLSTECGVCHVSNDFKAWAFDHDKQTDFKLKGAHKGIDCLVCHKDPVNNMKDLKLPKTCYACHAADDAHDGGFGRNCDRCHNEKAFDKVDMNALGNK